MDPTIVLYSAQHQTADRDTIVNVVEHLAATEPQNGAKRRVSVGLTLVNVPETPLQMKANVALYMLDL